MAILVSILLYLALIRLIYVAYLVDVTLGTLLIHLSYLGTVGILLSHIILLRH